MAVLAELALGQTVTRKWLDLPQKLPLAKFLGPNGPMRLSRIGQVGDAFQ